MKEISLQSGVSPGLDKNAIYGALKSSLADEKQHLNNVLLIPPDLTRMHSGAGLITAMLYGMLCDTCNVDILPALGTHDAMTDAEIDRFFGSDIPKSHFIRHNWRTDVEEIGVIPAGFVAEVSEGLVNNPISVQVNRRLVSGAYDRIISIGQVVPHEVVGMANYTKNILVGCGGTDIINQSHMLGAVYGMERMMGRDRSPVRQVFDYAEEHFLRRIPLAYVLTVTTEQGGSAVMHGLYIGRDRSLFEQAVALSQQKNLTFIDRPLKKVVVYLDESEFKSTWLGNKAVYRTRMAIADGGELIVLAPGVAKFGEDEGNDRLIRKYGYVGRDRVLKMCGENEDLRGNLSVAAHLIHGSSDGRFSITYAAGKLAREEIERAGYKYMDIGQAMSRYDPGVLKNGPNTLGGGEEIFYISNPALGLWACKEKFK